MSKLVKGRPRTERRVVINDSSCLITTCGRYGCCKTCCGYRTDFAVALPVQRAEVLSITPQEWGTLVQHGLDVVDLDGSQVEAIGVHGRHPRLSAADCFSLVLARSFSNAILLTGDAQLRSISTEVYNIEVHGVLWVTDELSRLNLLPTRGLFNVLSRG